MKERGDKRFGSIAKAAASRIRKGKASEINPGLFAEICAAKVTTPASAEDTAKAARKAFEIACLDLQKLGLVEGETLTQLTAVAQSLGVSIALPVPAHVVPATPQAAPDMAAVIAAAVAQAMAAMSK